MAGACQPPTVSHAIPSWFKIATSWDRNAALRQLEKYGPLDFLPFHPLWVKIQRTDPWRGEGVAAVRHNAYLAKQQTVFVCASTAAKANLKGGEGIILKVSPYFL